MKKLLFLLLFLPILLSGQVSVPNTETFSLQNVYDAVHDHTSGTQQNLQSCFDNAISSYFNPTYNQDSYAPANSMLRFRDYKPSNPCDYTTFTLYEEIILSSCGTYLFSGSSASATQACSDLHNPTCTSGGFAMRGPAVKAISIDVGNRLYGTSSPCSQLTITGYYIYRNSGTDYIVYVLSGVIQSKTQCYP